MQTSSMQTQSCASAARVSAWHPAGSCSKQLARLRDSPPGSPALWVYDERDWALMRTLPSGALVCPVQGCGSPFTVVRQNDFGTRWLCDRPGAECSHALTRPGGGGPMSAEHRWMQERLRRICAVLGHEAIPEHHQTSADLYLPDVKLVIEVQRWATDFAERTKSRESKGARVLWLITEDASGRSVERALRLHPCVRVRVHARGDRRRLLRPWSRPGDAQDAVLSVGARVAFFDRESGTLRLGWRDGCGFLDEVIRGERIWLPELAGLRGGAWVLTRDLVGLEALRPTDRSRWIRLRELLSTGVRRPIPRRSAIGRARP